MVALKTKTLFSTVLFYLTQERKITCATTFHQSNVGQLEKCDNRYYISVKMSTA